MPLRVLADESVDFRIVRELINGGFEVISVLRSHQGIPDKDVLELARRHDALLLTEDSDFGEWIFAHKEKGVSIIFLRYAAADFREMSNTVIKILNEQGASLYGKFVTVTTRKIRIRAI